MPLCLLTAAGQDFSGLPFNLTFVNKVPVQSVNVSILDDDIVEQAESIQLMLTTTNPDVIILFQNAMATIFISDNDGK